MYYENFTLEKITHESSTPKILPSENSTLGKFYPQNIPPSKIPPLHKNEINWRPSIAYTIFWGIRGQLHVDQTGIIALYSNLT